MAGELYALLAAITFPLSNTIFRKIDKKFSPLEINSVRTTIGAITFVILVVLLGFLPEITSFHLELQILLILILSSLFSLDS